ncbi:MAG: glycosyltransferase family 4 protein [bacterium]|nr:glycosyltransferase family 4 protein [bacterium]
MKLLLATSIKFPSPFANRAQITDMARGFFDALGTNFYFGGRNLPETNGRQINFVRINGKKISYLFAYHYMREIQIRGITHVYCREEKMLFFMLLYNLFYRTRVRFIYEAHFVPKKITVWWRFLLSRVGNVVATSSSIKKALSCYVKSKRIVVAVHGVDVERFAIDIDQATARDELKLPRKVSLVGYTGSVCTMGGVKKGMGELLDAVAQVDNLHLVAVGANALDIEPYINQAQRLGIAGRVLFREHVSRDTLALYQRACDVLVLPMPLNQYAYMLPLKVFEYMASGRPIVASRLPAVADVLDDNNSVLVEPGNIAELADALSRTTKNPSAYESLANTARKEVSRYTWAFRVRTILDSIHNEQ